MAAGGLFLPRAVRGGGVEPSHPGRYEARTRQICGFSPASGILRSTAGVSPYRPNLSRYRDSLFFCQRRYCKFHTLKIGAANLRHAPLVVSSSFPLGL